MLDSRRWLAVAVLLISTSAAPAEAQSLQSAELGSCSLESGAVLEPCTIGFRTLGTLNEERDNAILVPTWFTGTSEGALDYVRSVIDTTEFYAIVVDALGNGVSASPSNSPTQGGESFPRISVGDMVATQYRLVTEVLGLDRLHAVLGQSMGGMQTYEWMIAHPGFFAKAVPMIGSPKLGPYDIALWETLLRVLDLYETCECEDGAATLHGISMLVGSTPARVEAGTASSEVAAFLEGLARDTLQAPDGWTHDMASQLHAMIGHDVSRSFGGDMTAAAATVRAEMLSVVVGTDHVVTPWSAITFAELVVGESMVLDNDCGHGGLACGEMTYVERVRAFLARE